MKKKILISAGSLALTLVLVFAFAIQPGMKRGVAGRMKESFDKISGGVDYSAESTNFVAYTRAGGNLKSGDVVAWGGAAKNDMTTEAMRVGYAKLGASVDRVTTGIAESLGSRSADKPLIYAQGMSMNAALPQAMSPAYYNVPSVIVEPYVPQSGNGEKVIYSATVLIKVKSAQDAYDRAAKIARDDKGFVGGADFAQTQDGKVLATMNLRIPREKFEAALDALRAFGDVKNMSVSNNDVAQVYQQLSQELSNVKVIYDKMIEDFKDKKTDVETAQKMQNVFTPYLRHIDMLRHQLANLDNQISMATITVTFEESSLHTFLKHDLENIHEQAWERTAAAAKSLILMVPAFIAFVIALLCAIAAWNVLKDKFIKK